MGTQELLQPAKSSARTATGASLGHIRELDGIRGIAALMVFFHHLCFASIHPKQWGQGVRFIHAIASFGYAGVDLFFVLSGFLITSLLIKDRQNPHFYQDFYWKRALRILPIYLLTLLAIYFSTPGSGRFLVLSLLFLANFAAPGDAQVPAPFWTLSIEEQFYLLWPTVVRRRSVDQLSRWALAIGLGAVLLRIVAAQSGHYNYHITFLHCDGLAAGALLACWFERRARNPGRTTSLVPRERNLIASAVLGGLLLVAGSFLRGRHLNLPYASAMVQTGLTLGFAGFVAFVIANRGSRLVSLFRNPLFTFFGLISYAFYMTHLYVLMAYTHFVGELTPGDVQGYCMRLFGVLALTVIACLISRYLIELPAMSLRRFVLHRPAPTAEIQEPLFPHQG